VHRQATACEKQVQHNITTATASRSTVANRCAPYTKVLHAPFEGVAAKQPTNHSRQQSGGMVTEREWHVAGILTCSSREGSRRSDLSTSLHGVQQPSEPPGVLQDIAEDLRVYNADHKQRRDGGWGSDLSNTLDALT
jgi:hypothetical protein